MFSDSISYVSSCFSILRVCFNLHFSFDTPNWPFVCFISDEDDFGRHCNLSSGLDQLTSISGGGDAAIISQNYHHHLQQHQQEDIHGQQHHYQQHHLMPYQQAMYPGDVVSSLTSLKDGSSSGCPEITAIADENTSTLQDLIESRGLDSTTTGLLLGVLTGGHHHHQDHVIISTVSGGGVTASSTINEVHEPSSLVGHHHHLKNQEGNHAIFGSHSEYNGHHHQVDCHGMTMTTGPSGGSSSFKNNGEGSSISSSSSTTISGDHGMYSVLSEKQYSRVNDRHEEDQMKINVHSDMLFIWLWILLPTPVFSVLPSADDSLFVLPSACLFFSLFFSVCVSL